MTRAKGFIPSVSAFRAQRFPAGWLHREWAGAFGSADPSSFRSGKCLLGTEVLGEKECWKNAGKWRSVATTSRFYDGFQGLPSILEHAVFSCLENSASLGLFPCERTVRSRCRRSRTSETLTRSLPRSAVCSIWKAMSSIRVSAAQPGPAVTKLLILLGLGAGSLRSSRTCGASWPGCLCPDAASAARA